jgi:hypothetical protein
MDEAQKKLRQEMTNALRERSKHENRYFKARMEYEAKYGGDKLLAAGLEKKIQKKKTKKKNPPKKKESSKPKKEKKEKKK